MKKLNVEMLEEKCNMIENVIYGKHEQRFTLYGKALNRSLFMTDEKITQGMVKRLHSYALDRLDCAGFKLAVAGWSVEVYTIDAEEKPADRKYCVRFFNSDGGCIQVCGIFTRKGWPFLDHGLSIDG